MGTPHARGRAPAVATKAPAALTANAAMLQGTLSADGSPTSYQFDYGTTTSYGSSAPAPAASVAAGAVQLPVTQQISGLTPATTYHFRLVAANAAGTAVSPDATFVTAAAPPTVTTGTPTGISRYGATFQGTVNAEGSPTTYHFDIGKTTSYGESQPLTDASAGSGSTAQPVSYYMIEGLTPGTTYHCRIAATNSAGTAYGGDVTFTTQPPIPR